MRHPSVPASAFHYPESVFSGRTFPAEQGQPLVAAHGYRFGARGHDFGDITRWPPVIIAEHRSASLHVPCRNCDRLPNFDLDITTGIFWAKSDCPAPDGLTTITTVRVPSGRLVVTDDLRPVYDVPHDRDHGYGSLLGLASHTRRMADIGCAYGPVSNTSPTLYRTGTDTYAVASTVWQEFGDRVLPEWAGWTPLARIETILWAYSMADHADWATRDGPRVMREQNPHRAYEVIDVTPGTYEFTLHATRADFEHHDHPVVYATVRLLPPDLPAAANRPPAHSGAGEEAP